MTYIHGASRHTLAGLRNENRILKDRLEHAAQVIAELQAKTRAKPKKRDDYPMTTPEALQRELEKSRRRFPEPPEVKAARLAALTPGPRLKDAA